MSDVDALLARARELLGSAKLLLDHGDTASSISRAYYAMFMAAEAALLSIGVSASSHRGVVATFGEHFVKTGPFAKADGRDLAYAHEQRVAAEYDPSTRVPVEEATALLRTATGFVEKVTAFLGSVRA